MARNLEIEIESLKGESSLSAPSSKKMSGTPSGALVLRDTALATKVIDVDEEIDAMEVVLEEECLKTLALYQRWPKIYALLSLSSTSTTIWNGSAI